MDDAVRTAAHAELTGVESALCHARRVAGIRHTAGWIGRRTTRASNQQVGKGVHLQPSAAQTAEGEGPADELRFKTGAYRMRRSGPRKLVRKLDLSCRCIGREQATANGECAENAHRWRLRIG